MVNNPIPEANHANSCSVVTAKELNEYSNAGIKEWNKKNMLPTIAIRDSKSKLCFIKLSLVG